jgi:hypothetical protein
MTLHKSEPWYYVYERLVRCGKKAVVAYFKMVLQSQHYFGQTDNKDRNLSGYPLPSQALKLIQTLKMRVKHLSRILTANCQLPTANLHGIITLKDNIFNALKSSNLM